MKKQKSKGDSLGDRMKDSYENRTRHLLPRRTYTMIRVDGKAFHSYTRHLPRPYCEDFMSIMDQTAQAMCEEIQGARFAFVQSDEISVLLSDFDTPQTEAWFDGNLQKQCSISAAIATAAFNRVTLGTKLFTDLQSALDTYSDSTWGLFDARVFTIPDREEVVNYMIWRQQDATRNSIQMAAQSLYSHKELHGKNTEVLQEMIFQRGKNWNDYPVGFKRGRVIQKVQYASMVPIGQNSYPVRTRWDVDMNCPVFTKDRDYLTSMIPAYAPVLSSQDQEENEAVDLLSTKVFTPRD